MSPPTDTESTGIMPKRKRSSVACERCHHRKVRCIRSQDDNVCHNCKADGAECKLFRRKKLVRKSQKRAPETQARKNKDATLEPGISPVGTLTPIESCSPVPAPSLARTIGSHTSLSSENQSIFSSTLPHCVPHSGIYTQPNTVTDPSVGHEQCDDGRDVGVPAFNVAFGDELQTDVVPFFVGEEHGLGFMLDLCRPERSRGNHYPIPRVHRKRFDPDDMSYLRMKGVFKLPSESLRHELIKCYFHYVHPMFPIVEASTFLQNYVASGTSQISLLLLWSIFFVASGFLPKKSVDAAGYRSHKAMKHAIYKKAKCLYDMDFELDKTSLIQSVLLMSHWYADTEDRNGPWHWIGVAISLCQTMGLHRDLESSEAAKTAFDRAQIRLWRRIWWSCLYREIWNGVAFGRPVRIDIDHCDVLFPTPDEIWPDTATLPLNVQETYLPANCEPLSHLFCSILKLSVTLAMVVKAHYHPRAGLASLGSIERDEQEILSHRIACQQYDNHPDALVRKNAGFVRIHYEASLIILYRPYLICYDMDLTNGTGTRWRTSVIESAKRAADNIGAVLNSLTASDSIRWLESTIITVMKPAIHLNLFFAQSENSLIKRHARHELDLHLIVLEELRHSSWSASIATDLVQRALKGLLNAKIHDNGCGGSDTATANFESAEPRERQNEAVLQSADLDLIDAPLFSQDTGFLNLDPWTNEDILPNWEQGIGSIFDGHAFI